jgi:hypothetical protein
MTRDSCVRCLFGMCYCRLTRLNTRDSLRLKLRDAAPVLVNLLRSADSCKYLTLTVSVELEISNVYCPALSVSFGNIPEPALLRAQRAIFLHECFV